ncbi:hypothetical protein BAE44_0022958 [Dichanthelium oligosanthes]|uniref:DUF4220 domain-containing protein n=1 Tax=Dichanthelium oligosanthes TaxID=888268 RepID=A0A1E5UT33_9POAL|nr:hypothetical protein BAE44_0022958 [Dichanthelium oligosanthes]
MHAAMFAAGFPTTSLVLSLLLVAGTGYITYPVHYIPRRMDQSDHNRITHGVFITSVIIAQIIGKELAEIYIYVFSQWTVRVVLMLCTYAKHPRLRNLLVEAVMRMVPRLMTWMGREKFHKIGKAEKQEQEQAQVDVEAPATTEPQTKPQKHDGDHLQLSKSLTRKRVELRNELMGKFGKDTDKEVLWEKLATFWTGFLLHLAASTRASKHRTRLAGTRELTTHLWALLSHAGFLGSANYGHELLDRKHLEDMNPLS